MEQELGNKAAAELLQGADVVMDGPRLRMCVDIAAYVSESAAFPLPSGTGCD